MAWLVALMLVAELMRNTGRFTMADVLSFRLNQRPVRMAAALATLAVCLFYLIAQMAGAGGLVALLLNIDDSTGQAIVVAVVGLLMIVYVLVGGMKGTVSAGGFGSALSRVVAANTIAPLASQPHYISGGTPTQCAGGGTGTRMVNPAFVLVAPVGARDGGSGDAAFDGANNRAFAQGNGTCVTPPDYPGDERYDDLVVAESATALLGWLMATTR